MKKMDNGKLVETKEKRLLADAVVWPGVVYGKEQGSRYLCDTLPLPGACY